MLIVADTTVLIAVVLDEPHRDRLLQLTASAEIVAPASIRWEIGNALSAMFKRRSLTLEQAEAALRAFETIPMQIADISVQDAVNLCAQLQIYAYDAYMLVCAKQYACPLITLDKGLRYAAE